MFGLSKNQIKKFRLPIKLLNKPMRKKFELSLPIDLIHYHEINPIFYGANLPKVLSEDEDFLVLSKPYQVHCHPLFYSENDNILSFLREHNYLNELSVNAGEHDRGLLYRIDFETSGLLLYIRKNEKYKYFRDHFQSIVCEKRYLAVVDGKLESKKKINHIIKYTGSKNYKGIVCAKDEKDSFRAESFVTPLAYNEDKNCSLVELQLYEGIRHQLRIQMMAIGHAIIGDPLYSNRREERLFLHCWKYKLNYGDQIRVYHDPHFDLLDNFFNFNC